MKAQYLRIQALYLQKSRNFGDALDLLNVLLNDCPDEYSQTTAALMQKAECLWAMDDAAGAFDAYQLALESQRRRPHAISQVALSFAERFHDYNDGVYRELLVDELGLEIERIDLLDAMSKLRYSRIMERLLHGLGTTDEALKWRGFANDARERITLDSIRVGIEPPEQPVADRHSKENETHTRPRRGKSEFGETLDEIQRKLELGLRQHGFRRKGRAFNRIAADGITQVIGVEAGRFDPPGTVYVPGITRSLYGQFTINLGVYVPEVERWTNGTRKKSFVQDYDCCIRERLGNLGPEARDVWWWIEKRDDLVGELGQRLERDALPYFRRYETRKAILRELGAGDPATGGNPARIICAVILAHAGMNDQARSYLQGQVLDPAVRSRNPGHIDYVHELSVRLGLGDL